MVSRSAIIVVWAFVCVAGALACDPCAGMAGCNGEAHVGVTGRLLEETTGDPAVGVAIDLVRTGGVALERDSVRTHTDAHGVFELDVTARGAGAVEGYVAVRPRGSAGYRVMNLDLQTSARRGEARALVPWSTVPALRDYAVISLRGAPSMIAASVPIEFRRTGGAAVDGLVNDVFSATTDSSGSVPLFGFLVSPLDVGDVIGDLTVFFPLPIGPKVRRDVRVPASAVFRKQLQLMFLGVGPSLEYHIETGRRGSYGEYVQGVRVEFERTGGIAVEPANWVSFTDPGGRVAFPVRAMESGTLTGNVRIIPPAPWVAFERQGLSFPTFDADGARLILIVEVGPGIGGFVRVHANGTPLKGAEVEFRHTGGIVTRPFILKAVSNDTGFAYITAATETPGEVVGDVFVRPPAPHASFVVRGIRVQAFDGDAPAVPNIIGDWNASNPPSALRRHP
jgi:hypothetical protein